MTPTSQGFNLKTLNDKASSASKNFKDLEEVKSRAFPKGCKDLHVVTRYDNNCWIMELNSVLNKTTTLTTIVSFAVSPEHRHDDEVIHAFQDTGFVFDEYSYAISVFVDILKDGKRDPKKSTTEYMSNVDGKLITTFSVFNTICNINKRVVGFFPMRFL